MSVTILKLGGSLLDLPDLADRIVRLVDAHTWSAPVIVTGGGELADGIRRLDARWHLPAALCHQLAIQAMSLNAEAVRALHTRFTAGPGTSEGLLATTQDSPPQRTIVVPRPDELLATLEASHAPRLPRTWQITSDSIAAWIAGCLSARLVLLKSVDLPAVDPAASVADQKADVWAELERSELVDREFATWAHPLAEVQWCNLRRQPAVCQPLKGGNTSVASTNRSSQTDTESLTVPNATTAQSQQQQQQ